MSSALKIALLGNPNSGKTSLFNALTGLRQRVGNFPGVTVDRKSGLVSLPGKGNAELVDLPGTYSIYARSQDERVATSILIDPEHADHPDLVLLVADATNLRRSLLLCTQVMDLGLPTILVLNMSDLLSKEGITIDTAKLERYLGIPIVSVSALKSKGLKTLKKELAKPVPAPEKSFFQLGQGFDGLLEEVSEKFPKGRRYLHWLARISPKSFKDLRDDLPSPPENAQDLLANELTVRYDRIQAILDESLVRNQHDRATFSGEMDRILLHPVWGYGIFIVVLFLIFQAIFAWATWPMDMIEYGFAASGEWMADLLPDTWYSSLLVDGIWAGLGGIVIFVPQIAILFLFISILEDSGYMSRVVFLMDRIMRPFGFSGKSVIPLIGGMACAVPSIMMARTIPHRIERLITIMVTPLMSCSARIPVYVLLISLFVPDESFLGIFNMQGAVMTLMYLLGFFMALITAWVIKVMARYKSTGIFVVELPKYRMPRWKNSLLEMYHRSRTFVLEAGKVILVISVVLWFLASYGPSDNMQSIAESFDTEIAAAAGNPDKVEELEIEKSSAVLKASYAGEVGHFIEPVIKPLGFDWKIGISLITSFAAREVFVGTMATIYSAGDDAVDDEEGKYLTIRERMALEKNPDTGQPIYSSAAALSLLIFYAFAMQCMSTLAVVKKETRSWKLTFIMLFYMTGLAYFASLITYQVLA